MAEPQPVFFKDSARRVQCKMKVNKLQFIGLIGGLIGGGFVTRGSSRF